MTGKSSLCFLASLTPVGDFNMISEAICIPFVAIESYQSALFPSAMLTDYWKSAPKKEKSSKETEQWHSDSNRWFGQGIYSIWNVHSYLCKFSVFSKPMFFLMHDKCVDSLTQTHATHTHRAYFPSDLSNPLNKLLTLNNNIGCLLLLY